MKVAILSSFYPLRGGISQFNASLLAGLGKLHDARAYSFKRQYPEILFPGKTQYVTPDDEAVPVEAEALLDTPSVPRNGYYAFVCEKCAPTFSYYGYFLTAEKLTGRAEEIYGNGKGK